MKKKIFALITAVALVAILCLSLVACNKDDELSPVKFSDKMSQDEIVEELGKIKNCTVAMHMSDDSGIVSDMTYYLTEEKLYYTYTNGVEEKGSESFGSWAFFEGKRGYEIVMSTSEEGSDDSIIILDYTDYDVVELNFDDTIGEYVKMFSEYVKAGKCVVEDGNLKYEETEESGSFYYMLKDCNTTKVPSIPEKYKDYKNMDATEEIIEYELSNDETYYVLDYIDRYIKSYEVPETYNGKPIKEIDYSFSSSNLKTLTISTNIVKLDSYCSHDEEDEELHIIYKGTKAQWAEIENHEKYNAEKGIRVTCTDGDYVETTTEE